MCAPLKRLYVTVDVAMMAMKAILALERPLEHWMLTWMNDMHMATMAMPRTQ